MWPWTRAPSELFPQSKPNSCARFLRSMNCSSSRAWRRFRNRWSAAWWWKSRARCSPTCAGVSPVNSQRASSCPSPWEISKQRSPNGWSGSSRIRCSRSSMRPASFCTRIWGARRFPNRSSRNFAARPRSTAIWNTISKPARAEAAIVVNNCAAAVLVTLAALARGGEVIVSRGELIEIGDGFRIPEIMEQSGAVLREVGTTNRTHLADYGNAINEKTRILLRVHPSNFKVTGFTDKPSIEELVALSQQNGLPLVEDLGSGCLVDISEYGVSEPTVKQSVQAGVSVVMFSGDKLLGGPQAGIIAGKKELIARVRRYPLFRALRVDKLTIAALEATLGAYLRAAWDEIPAMRMIRATPQELKRRAENFIRELRPELPLDEVEIEIADGSSLAGAAPLRRNRCPPRSSASPVRATQRRNSNIVSGALPLASLSSHVSKTTGSSWTSAPSSRNRNSCWSRLSVRHFINPVFSEWKAG